jgi:hypothetical protein
MNRIFPLEINNIILNFTNINNYWKTRFTNDVLPEINKHYRLIGMDCEIHEEQCKCTNKIPCFYCYLYDECYCHVNFDYIPFEHIKKECYELINYRYMPLETFLYIFDTYEDGGRYINSIKSQLEYYIINKKYILKNISY